MSDSDRTHEIPRITDLADAVFTDVAAVPALAFEPVDPPSYDPRIVASLHLCDGHGLVVSDADGGRVSAQILSADGDLVASLRLSVADVDRLIVVARSAQRPEF